jgi:hypothetical protein
MPEDELKRKLVSEIRESGYPLGLFTRRQIHTSDWSVWGSRDYLSADGSRREVDVEAFIQDLCDPIDSGTSLSSVLICECKANKNNPWVFFQEVPAFKQLHNIEFPDFDVEREFFRKVKGRFSGYHLYNPKAVSTEWLVAFCGNSRENRQI